MADLQERLVKLKKVEQAEELAGLITRIGQLIENIHAGLFRVYDEDLASLKEDSVAAGRPESAAHREKGPQTAGGPGGLMAGRKEEAYFDQAERLYVRENKTPEQISQILPVCANTIAKWGQKGGWGKKRQAALASPRTLAEKLRIRLEGLLNELEIKEGLTTEALLALPGISDAIYKTVCAIDKTERYQDLRVLAVEVMRAYTDWLRGQDLAPGELEMHGGRIRGWFRSLE